MSLDSNRKPQGGKRLFEFRRRLDIKWRTNILKIAIGSERKSGQSTKK